MAKVYLGLGSNIDSEQNLRLGVSELRRHFGALELSGVYESTAVGFDGPDFLNLVAGLTTDEPPGRVRHLTESIHALSGRDRGSDRFASRPLDIDLLLYDDRIVDEPHLKLPRCDVLEYSFVLRPLAELAPDLVHPVTGRTIAAHWHEFDTSSHPLRPVDVIL